MVLGGGCAPLRQGPSESLLKKAQMSPDSFGLEIFFIRFPFGDAEANGQLWNETDEQHFSAEIRQQLAQNGFRVGILSGQIPVALSKLLELPEKSPPPGQPMEINSAGLESEPRVARRLLQLRSGRRGEVVVSGTYEQLPVLLRESGEICGQTYYQAQGLLALTPQPERDGRVRLTLIPELHHGQPRQQWVGGEGADQGLLRLQAGRPRRIFDAMTVVATLAPGDMLLMSSLPNRPGSLGHHFFTCGETQRREQKLLVIRLAQTQHNDLLAPNAVLPLE